MSHPPPPPPPGSGADPHVGADVGADVGAHVSADSLGVLPVDGIGEVEAGSDLAALLAAAVRLRDGDVVVVTSKVVSKAEGRVRSGKRAEAVVEESDRTLARRAGTSIVRTRHGLVMAAAGVDASNTEPGTVVLLPVDPDASARRLRESLRERTGCNVAVLVTDTAGRAWREGQTDIAVGAAGIEVLHDYAGRIDPHGNELSVTAPAVADELAGAADLVKGKLGRRPAAVVRGLPASVLPAGRHGPGAVALVRPEGRDMFGLGAREAVLAAVRREDPRGFGTPVPALELVAELGALSAAARLRIESADRVVLRLTDAGDGPDVGAAEAERCRVAAFALGWVPDLEPARGDAEAGSRPSSETGAAPPDIVFVRAATA